MKRVNGFLNLDEYFRNLSKSGVVTSDSIEEINSYSEQYWLKIEGIIYNFKVTLAIYEEVIVSECAKFLEIDYVDYDLATFKGKQGVISQSYRKENCKYISGMDILYDYLIDSNNREFLEEMGCDCDRLDKLKSKMDLAEHIHTLEIIWQALEYRYSKLDVKVNIYELIKGLITHFCLDILTGQFDGFPQNWVIEEGINGISLAPYLDGSATFGSLKVFQYPRESMAISFKDKNTNNYRILEEFFNTSSQEFIDIFLEKFNKFDLENFLSILSRVETKITTTIPSYIKDRVINEFKNNRERIEEVINKMNLNQSRK